MMSDFWNWPSYARPQTDYFDWIETEGITNARNDAVLRLYERQPRWIDYGEGDVYGSVQKRTATDERAVDTISRWLQEQQRRRTQQDGNGEAAGDV